jgi:tripeptidyl-peptidase-1
MMLVSPRLLLALILVPSFIGAAPGKCCGPHRVKETAQPPRGWTKKFPPPPDHSIALKIALPQPNFHILESHLYEISDPFHERYGAHLSKEEVEELVAPHQDSIDMVNEWLASHGIQESDLSRSPARDWVTIKVPLSLAENMLNTVSDGLGRCPWHLIHLECVSDVSHLDA